MSDLNKNTNFLLCSLEDLLSQFEITDKVQIDSLEANISKENKTDVLHILYNKKELNFKLPVKVDEIVSKLLFYQSQKEFKLGPLLFNPSKQLLISKNLQITLRHSHNKMLSEIMINKENGVTKLTLYEKLWPNDVDIQMNKLDTHLTNLKKVIYENFSYEIILKTVNGKLIIIN